MQQLKHSLSLIDGVLAVGLGGSRGLGLADENSDYDFVIFHEKGKRIEASLIIEAIKPFVALDTIEDTAGFVRAHSPKGKIDIFQKDLGIIEGEIQAVLEGKFRWSVRQLFPHGDLSTCLVTHIIHLELCSEKDQRITRLRNQVIPMPAVMQNALVNYFTTQALITITHASKIKKTADFQYLLALCSAYAFFANIVIFAANKQYPILEKGGTRIINNFPLRPKYYDLRIANAIRYCLEGKYSGVVAELSAIQDELNSITNQPAENLPTSTRTEK